MISPYHDQIGIRFVSKLVVFYKFAIKSVFKNNKGIRTVIGEIHIFYTLSGLCQLGLQYFIIHPG